MFYWLVLEVNDGQVGIFGFFGDDCFGVDVWFVGDDFDVVFGNGQLFGFDQGRQVFLFFFDVVFWIEGKYFDLFLVLFLVFQDDVV